MAANKNEPSEHKTTLVKPSADSPGSTNGDETLGDASGGSGSPGTPANTPAMSETNTPANEPSVSGAAVDGDYAAFLTWKRQNAAQGVPVDQDDREVYVWLADGSVEKVKARDLPGSAGTNAQNGYYERDGKMFSVVAVHDMEHDA